VNFTGLIDKDDLKPRLLNSVNKFSKLTKEKEEDQPEK
jgi:hypothetical protein